MPRSEIFYGDVHWHTHFSDNRDRASVEEMVRKAARYGLTILGTGDHNHNLTAATWKETRAETEALRRILGQERAGLVVLNNCEMTFMVGHFLVFEPPHVDGTAAEAYGYLYGKLHENLHERLRGRLHEHLHERLRGSSGPLLMINHPGLPSDEWGRRIIPGAGAVEVINGAVIRDAAGRGFGVGSFAAPLEAPMLSVYGRYAACGLPVAAIGSSDAHRLRELGYGVTGYLLSGPATADTVLEAIRGRRTFAATDAGIELRWEVSGAAGRAGGARLTWTSRFRAAPGRPDVSPADDGSVHSWVYRGRRLIQESGSAGEAPLRPGGLYWIVTRAGSRFAVSSMIGRGGPTAAPSADAEAEADAEAAADIRLAADLIMKDIAWRSRSAAAAPAADAPAAHAHGMREPISFLCESSSPIIADALGRDVHFEVLRHERPRRIIDKEGPLTDFDEFDAWLERNEVHECRFEALTWRLEGTVFHLEAALLPVMSDQRPGAAERYRAHIASMRDLVAKATKLSIRVGLLPTITARLSDGDWSYPLTVTDPAMDLGSELREVSASPGQYPFPASWRAFVGPEERRFVCQYFT